MRGAAQGALMALILGMASLAGSTPAGKSSARARVSRSIRGSVKFRGGSRNSKTAARRKARNHVRVRAMRRRKAGRV